MEEWLALFYKVTLMKSTISSNKTIAKNTFFLYVRLLFNLIVSLYTSRLVLNTLGTTDYGVFQAVAGIIVLFLFLNGALSAASSRYLAFHLGKGDDNAFRDTFSASVKLFLILSIVVFILCETVGLWIVVHKLVIPVGRETVAWIVYQAAVGMTILSIINIPYSGVIIAYEKMTAFAYLGILDTLLKLLSVLLLIFVPYDKLLFYALCLFVSSFVLNICTIQYGKFIARDNVQVSWKKLEQNSFKQLFSFSAWNFYVSFTNAGRVQGQTILLNIFFGVVANAACGISNTVYGAIVGFVNNVTVSIRPVLTKCYSIGDLERMQGLMYDSCRFMFCVLLFLVPPFLFESNFILKVWLSQPPLYAAVLCKLQLLTLLVAVIVFPIRFALEAIGDIKYLSLIDGSLYLFFLPITYLMLKLGCSVYSPFILLFLFEFVKLVLFPRILRNLLSNFSIKAYFKNGVLPCAVSFLVVIIVCGTVFYLSGEGIMRFVCVCITSLCSTCLVGWNVLLTKERQKQIVSLLKRVITEKWNKNEL